MKIYKLFKDVGANAFEITEVEARKALFGFYKDIDLMIDGLRDGTYSKDRPIPTHFCLIWAEKDNL